MAHDLTHASFFTGAGGLDLGLTRAGWRTVSTSEIDPYACALIAERFPDAPNLGDISAIEPESLPEATLWSGGFPCQDLSIAGRRAGLAGERSGLALAFLDLVERRRPPAVLLENVPGLLSSHAGRDFGALIHRLAELGYVGAYRVLDAQFFGVPQRRPRVFILALDAGRGATADGAGAILAVGTRCGGHREALSEEGTAAAVRFSDGTGGAGPLEQAVVSKWAKRSSGPAGDEHHHLVIRRRGAEAHPDGGGAPTGLAGRLDDRPRVEGSHTVSPALEASLGHHGWGGGRGDGSKPYRLVYRKGKRAASEQDDEKWLEDTRANTLTAFDAGDVRATHLVVRAHASIAGAVQAPGETGGWRYDADSAGGGHLVERSAAESELDPEGLDSHRYRLVGNGVAAPVAEWIGQRLRQALEEGLAWS